MRWDTKSTMHLMMNMPQRNSSKRISGFTARKSTRASSIIYLLTVQTKKITYGSISCGSIVGSRVKPPSSPLWCGHEPAQVSPTIFAQEAWFAGQCWVPVLPTAHPCCSGSWWLHLLTVWIQLPPCTAGPQFRSRIMSLQHHPPPRSWRTLSFVAGNIAANATAVIVQTERHNDAYRVIWFMPDSFWNAVGYLVLSTNQVQLLVEIFWSMGTLFLWLNAANSSGVSIPKALCGRNLL